tara:strand:+ start:48 stop:461 length:414 start_codon:yes stop_codon:yes gene_type:complete
MADIEHALRNRIRSSSDVTDIVATRVFPIVVPSGQSLPAIVYELVSSDPQESNDGHSALTYARFSVDCMAKSYSDVKDLAEKVRLAVTGYSGTEASVVVTSTRHLSSSDEYSPPANAGERGTHHVVLDFRMGYQSAT